MEEKWTIGRLLQWTTEYLRQRGSSTPRLDAELLLAHAIGCQRIELYTQYDSEPDEQARAKFREYVRRRGAGEPVAYLIGGREFFSLWFEVTPAVLVPRPETELVVTTVLDIVKSSPPQESWDICDVGTGSGVIAICLAKYLPSCQVTAVDISSEALQVAARNAARHQVAERIEFVHGDLLRDLPAEKRFHIIASNPPYVGEDELHRLAPDVRSFEPVTALLAGKEGTEVIAALTAQAAPRLKSPGWVVIEISPQIADKVASIIAAQPELELVEIRKDLARLPRVVVARLRK
ncbi:MAG: peptide chain release factor N(5)-glutamine methyltransferase [Thermoguttaceae bacterium]|nr:peptide chain release factor N(5)-glutamine methyltransferase [Thermoguttaceae bacterium]MDW8080096.1 peptide chain release factor N(5)-glutamine methyltransferase [Thermoguttaceae bacterium]